MNTYHVGDSNGQITIAADIDTFGLAASRAIVLDLQIEESATTVGTSVDATGDISARDIGSAFLLAGKRLSVVTKIDLLGSEQDRQREAERLNGRYMIDNGADGLRIFIDPEKVFSDDGKTVILFFVIDLIR